MSVLDSFQVGSPKFYLPRFMVFEKVILPNGNLRASEIDRFHIDSWKVFIPKSPVFK